MRRRVDDFVVGLVTLAGVAVIVLANVLAWILSVGAPAAPRYPARAG